MLSSRGGSPLQIGLFRGLHALGHEPEPYHSGTVYDLILVFDQCSHTTDYEYPQFPTDKTPIAFIDSAEYGYFKRLPGVIRQYATAFMPSAMMHDTKNYGQQDRLRQFLCGRSFPYFLREFSKHVKFPVGYHPIDYPLYRLSECHDRPDREHYLRRSEDLFCSWGASHPWRWPITHALRAHPCKKTVLVLEENGTPRMCQSEYFQRTRDAKCSVSYDGYGSGSFRMTEVLCRTVLLQGPLSIKTRAPLIDGETCVMYHVESEGENFLSTDIQDKLTAVLDDPVRSYGIYERGYDHVFSFLTEAATAKYVLEVVEAHDWSKPTPLEIA